jgi:hypothetical protein
VQLGEGVKRDSRVLDHAEVDTVEGLAGVTELARFHSHAQFNKQLSGSAAGSLPTKGCCLDCESLVVDDFMTVSCSLSIQLVMAASPTPRTAAVTTATTRTPRLDWGALGHYARQSSPPSSCLSHMTVSTPNRKVTNNHLRGEKEKPLDLEINMLTMFNII